MPSYMHEFTLRNYSYWIRTHTHKHVVVDANPCTVMVIFKNPLWHTVNICFWQTFRYAQDGEDK